MFYAYFFNVSSNFIHVNDELCILPKGCLWIGILNVGNIFFPIMHCQVAEVTMNNSVGMQTSLVFNIQIVPDN